MTNRIDATELRSYLRADADAGRVYWLPRVDSDFPAASFAKAWNGRYAGKEAFTSLNKAGRAHGGLLGKSLFRSRVLWALVHGHWPDGFVDHINGVTSDDRICNLRDVNQSTNMRNARTPSHNKSGHIGVFWNTQKRKWAATIKVNRRNLHLGFFDRFEAACEARKTGETFHGFHENHGR